MRPDELCEGGLMAFISANNQISVTKALRDEKEKDAGLKIASAFAYRPDVPLQRSDYRELTGAVREIGRVLGSDKTCKLSGKTRRFQRLKSLLKPIQRQSKSSVAVSVPAATGNRILRSGSTP
jgi:hypothetical protein